MDVPDLISWQYLGDDSGHFNKTYEVPKDTVVVCDHDIIIEGIAKADRTFILDRKEGGLLHGYYFVHQDGIQKRVDIKRSGTHIKPLGKF